MTDYYEIIVIDKECYGEVISFRTNEFMNDSNDIVSYAIKLNLIDEKERFNVRCARAVSEFEYERMKKEFQQP